MDYLENIDQGIKAWEDAIKKEQNLKSDLDDIAGHVGEALAKQKFGTPYQVDYDGRLFQFVFRIGVSGRHGRVDMLTTSNGLIVKPRKFKAEVTLNKDVSLPESIAETVRALLYRYYDLIADEDHVY